MSVGLAETDVGFFWPDMIHVHVSIILKWDNLSYNVFFFSYYVFTIINPFCLGHSTRIFTLWINNLETRVGELVG